MSVTAPQLDAERMAIAMSRIAAWLSSPDAEHACPACETLGVVISDHSARPYTEWYAIKCSACGLDAMVSVPLGPPVVGQLD
ncbi:MAG: hypothetical protein ACRCS9_05650 [Hyphomicrobium sp.]